MPFTDDTVHEWLAEIAAAAWVSLHYESPALGGTGLGEISGGGYVRCLVPFSEPANRSIWSLKDAKWHGLVQNRLTHFGVWDDEFKGSLKGYGELPKEAIVVEGKGYVITEGQLALSIA